jgi:hypothetical protein
VDPSSEAPPRGREAYARISGRGAGLGRATGGCRANRCRPWSALADYVAQLGDRWARGIDPTSTLDPNSSGLRKRVLPALGHLPVSMMAAGLIDRAIDQWEAAYGRSTVKNTIAALVLVLDEAVRDGLLVRNLGEGSGSAGVSSAGLRRLAGREHVEPAGRGSRAEGWLSGPG